MTRQAISELLERVRAATGPDREIDAAIASALRVHPYGTDHWFLNGREVEFRPTHAGWLAAWRPADDTPVIAWESPAYTSSLDAIVALIERELGEWDISLDRRDEGNWSCWIERPQHRLTYGEGYGDTRALALCAAFLSALSAKHETMDGNDK